MTTNPSDVSARLRPANRALVTKSFRQWVRAHFGETITYRTAWAAVDTICTAPAAELEALASLLDAQSKLLAEREWRDIAVKLLEWDGRSASAPFGAYELIRFFEDRSWHVYFNRKPIAVEASEDDAKAAAQADYEARIRSALLPKPPIPTEGNDDV